MKEISFKTPTYSMLQLHGIQLGCKATEMKFVV